MGQKIYFLKTFFTAVKKGYRLPGYQKFGLRMVPAYHWLPEFRSQTGHRLPLVTRILVSGWLPVTTGYQNFSLRVVTGYHWLQGFRSQIGNRLPPVTKFDHLDRFPSVTSFAHLSRLRLTSGYRKNQNSNRTCRPLLLRISF